MLNSLFYMTGLIVWMGALIYFIFYVVWDWCAKLWRSVRHRIWFFQIYQLFRLKKLIKEEGKDNFSHINQKIVSNYIKVFLSQEKKHRSYNKSIVRRYALNLLLDLYFIKLPIYTELK